jgi:hypothetical protein
MAKKGDRYLAAEVESLREEFLNSTVKGTGYERVLAAVVRGVLPHAEATCPSRALPQRGLRGAIGDTG